MTIKYTTTFKYQTDYPVSYTNGFYDIDKAWKYVKDAYLSYNTSEDLLDIIEKMQNSLDSMKRLITERIEQKKCQKTSN